MSELLTVYWDEGDDSANEQQSDEGQEPHELAHDRGKLETNTSTTVNQAILHDDGQNIASCKQYPK